MNQFFKIVLMCGLTYTPYASSDFNDIFFDEEDDYAFMNEYLDTAAIDCMTRTIDPQEIMTILNLIDYPSIIQNPLFKETNILNKRSLLDQPIFEPDRAVFPKNGVFTASFFARKTSRSNFTKNSTKLCSYIALTDQLLLASLQNSVIKIDELFPGFDINVEKILNLFANMTVDDRQTGFMFQYMQKWHNTTFRILAPLYYFENNFSLTKEEQDAVAQEFGEQTPEEEKAFRKAHFISDKIGMGDTRIEIDQRILKRPSLTFRAGIQATIPTAFTWGGGFLGSRFAKPSTLPTLDLEPIFEAFENPTPETEQFALNNLGNFFLDAFDRVAANLLDTKLGNNRHLGLGVYVRTKTPLRAYINSSFAEKINLTNRISAEFFCPSMEKRFYTNRINEQAFNNRNFKDLSQASENLQFLEEQTIERLFLQAFTTRIRPGAIFRWTNCASYAGQRWGFNLGTDFWIQSKDKFSTIYASPTVLNSLDVPKAKPPFAEQSKVFAGVILKHKTPQNYFFVSLNADATLSNKGLGNDYGVSLNFEANF